MKKKLIRKTITIPEDIYSDIKQIAVATGKSFSSYVSDTLSRDLYSSDKTENKDKPLTLDDVMGVYSLGIKGPIYKKRSDLYEDHIKRKMGY